MPNPLVVFPDDELAYLLYLRSISALTALIPAASIIQQLPPNPTYPYVLVQRAGGQSPADSRAMDEPSLQVDTLATDRAQAKKLMTVVRGATLGIANDIISTVGVLVSAYEEVGPSWLPDTVSIPPIPRYVARFRVLLHN